MYEPRVLVSLALAVAGIGCGLRSQPNAPDGGVLTSGSGGGFSVSGGGGSAQGGTVGAPGMARGGAGMAGAGGAGLSASGDGGPAGQGKMGGMGGMGGIGGMGQISPSDGGVDVSTCTPGKACTPANPCHIGQLACSAAGVASSCTDTNAVQPDGSVCAVVESGSATCTSGTCNLSCSAGRIKCSGAFFCQIPSWGFEDGTTGGFTISGKEPMAATSLSVSKAIAHAGSYSLAIAVKAKGAKRSFEIALPICGGGSGFAPASGQLVTAWFYIAPDANSIQRPPATSAFGQHLTTSTGDVAMLSINSTVATWFQITTPITSLGSQVTKLAIDGAFGTDSGAAYDWSGTIYVDDIAFQ